MQALVITLWLIPLAVWAAPRLAAPARRAFRSRDGLALALLAAALTFRAFPSSAEKGGGQPPPPPRPPEACIRLYYHTPDGRLVPFDPPVREEAP